MEDFQCMEIAFAGIFAIAQVQQAMDFFWEKGVPSFWPA
jgi:hypothetical protein